MITLTTGQPGAGKTLYTLAFVNALGIKENRQVYYSGIADLKIPGWIELDNAEQWYTLPAGSIILIDECQRLFRPRGNGSTVPEYVSKLETHRHDGLDLFFITQHPMLVDTNVRRLVGRHFHVQRTFGMQRATVHEFPDLRQEPDKSREGSIRHDFNYPKEVFTWYKSAEVHTVKRRLPMRLYILFMLPILIAALAYGAYNWLQGKAAPKTGAVGAPAATAAPVPGAPSQARTNTLTTPQYLEQYTPRIDGLPHTAPAFDKVMEVRSAPQPAACIASTRKCTCYTDQATPILMGEALCRSIAERGFYDVTQDGSSPNHPEAPATANNPPPASQTPT
ncbi:MAG TPA: zonular occludens toxin domain-containing protein [Methylophilaceae bacterium]|nr:zonular occludens toxin domain-containing protein [Methylophilaceae bacterium]